MKTSIKKLFVITLLSCIASTAFASNYSLHERIMMSYVAGYTLGHDGKIHRAPPFIMPCLISVYLDATASSLYFDNANADSCVNLNYYIYNSNKEVVRGGMMVGGINGTVSLNGLGKGAYILQIVVDGNTYNGDFTL